MAIKVKKKLFTSQKNKPLNIGIVACSAEGAALCYRTICAEGAQLIGIAHAHPEISMHSQSLADYVAFIGKDDWKGVGELMLDSANKLAKIGAEFLIFPDNTIHQALPYIKLPLPYLHIAEVVAAEGKKCDYKRLGLTGTKWLVESNVYPKVLKENGLSYVRPSEEEREEINRIIMDELVPGIFKPEATQYFQEVITRLKDQGCDAVILGCTEIPLIINDTNSPLPILDSTRLLARAALHKACHTT
jgi:aspartate racemase